MIKVLVTGGRGFVGRNLIAHLAERKDCIVLCFNRGDTREALKERVLQSDIIFHLAGVNRPTDPQEFITGNTGLTEEICNILRNAHRSPRIIFSSSIQVELNNPYGVSKANAEAVLLRYTAETGAIARIYRLKNLFGKWCRPNYNSVTATFCHNIANEQPISISDPEYEVELSYVDDVVGAFIEELDCSESSARAGSEIPSYRISLGELAGRINAFHDLRDTVTLPDFDHWFNRALYATYLSYSPQSARQRELHIHSDPRGSLAEFIKGKNFGQVFVSRTMPGITRGNHYHHTKTEMFLVVEGEGLIRMRPIEGGPVSEYRVTGGSYQVVDIPPGFTHSITNVGSDVMVTLFWSSEIFDRDRPDTYYLPVDAPTGDASISLEKA